MLSGHLFRGSHWVLSISFFYAYLEIIISKTIETSKQTGKNTTRVSVIETLGVIVYLWRIKHSYLSMLTFDYFLSHMEQLIKKKKVWCIGVTATLRRFAESRCHCFIQPNEVRVF